MGIVGNLGSLEFEEIGGAFHRESVAARLRAGLPRKEGRKEGRERSSAGSGLIPSCSCHACDILQHRHSSHVNPWNHFFPDRCV